MTVEGKDIKITGRLVRIARLEAEGYFFLESDPRGLIDELRKFDARIDLFTFTQRVPDTSPKFHYPMEWDNCAAVEVTSFDHWWTRQIRPEARNRARQAEKKGVVIREVPFGDELVNGIWEIYNEAAIRGGRRFPHFGEDLQTVYDEEATFLDRSVFIGAYLDSSLIGFVKLTADETGTQANLMNILSMVKHRDKAPTNALIAHAVRACASRKISYLVYQRYSYGKKRADGVVKFKEVNGFKQFDLPRYYVPLTALGRAAFQLKLHHRLADRLPESIADRLREMRSAWYNRKLQGIKESAG
jgi:hypothetical protein